MKKVKEPRELIREHKGWKYEGWQIIKMMKEETLKEGDIIESSNFGECILDKVKLTGNLVPVNRERSTIPVCNMMYDTFIIKELED